MTNSKMLSNLCNNNDWIFILFALLGVCEISVKSSALVKRNNGIESQDAMALTKLVPSLSGFSIVSDLINPTEPEALPDLMESFVKPAFDEVNVLRIKYNLANLTLDEKLILGAQEWADNAAMNNELKHSCSRCDDYVELLAQKTTTGKVPRGKAGVSWALNRWFGNLITDTTPATDTAKAYATLFKKPNLSSMGIGIAYGVTDQGEKTVFAVIRFKKPSKSGRGKS